GRSRTTGSDRWSTSVGTSCGKRMEPSLRHRPPLSWDPAAYPDFHAPRRWSVQTAMTQTLASIGVVLFFILLAAVFVAAEIALVSLRDSQAAQLVNRGRRGRIVAELSRDPNRFLAASQV